MSGRVLKTREVAERLGLHLKTVEALARGRKIPCYRISDGPRGHFRFREDQVDAWLERRRVRPIDEPAPVRHDVRDETFR